MFWENEPTEKDHILVKRKKREKLWKFDAIVLNKAFCFTRANALFNIIASIDCFHRGVNSGSSVGMSYQYYVITWTDFRQNKKQTEHKIYLLIYMKIISHNFLKCNNIKQ